MKTVMKKMFSLLLVAVLLVGVMPFQASAATYTVEFQVKYPDGSLAVYPHGHEGNTFSAHDFLNFYVSGWSDSYVIDQVWMNGSQVADDTITPADSDCAMGVVLTEKHIHNYSVATCTTPGTCSCGATNSVDPNNHNYSDWSITTPATCIATGIKTRTCSYDANHTDVQVIPVDSNAHNFSGGKCTLCNKCQFCGNIGSHPENCKYYCNGATNCPNDPTVAGAHNDGCLKTKCNKNGCTKDYNHEGDCNVPCTKTPGCVLKQSHSGDCNTPCTFEGCTLGYKHTEKHHSNACSTCGKAKIKSPEHNPGCDYYYVNAEPTIIPGDSDLHVFVNLYTADTLVKTTHLKSYEDISSETLIYDFISDHAQELEAELEEDGHYGYSWSGHVYDKDNKGNPVTMKAKVGKGATVHINAYTDQDLIYIYVHNSRSMSNLRIIQLPGKKVGETVTKSEVTNAVAKYFNISSLAMYSEQGWEDYVDGHSVDAVSSLKVTSDPYFIDVKVAGTAKSTSGTKADSSNPKTGDTIYAPVMVMGASVSALAVLFYLNKKRAY